MVIGVVVAIATIVLLVALIRTRRLQERHALLWMGGALVIVAIGASEAVLDWIADLLGIAYPPSALFLIVLGFLALALLDAVVSLSKLTARSRTLAQRVAILEERLAELEQGVSTDHDAAEGTTPAGTPGGGTRDR